MRFVSSWRSGLRVEAAEMPKSSAYQGRVSQNYSTTRQRFNLQRIVVVVRLLWNDSVATHHVEEARRHCARWSSSGGDGASFPTAMRMVPKVEVTAADFVHGDALTEHIQVKFNRRWNSHKTRNVGNFYQKHSLHVINLVIHVPGRCSMALSDLVRFVCLCTTSGLCKRESAT